MTTLERFDKWKNPARPADNKIRVRQHQTSFFIIVQSNKIQCHVYQITWYKVEQQLYNRMISQFSIYTLILGIFDWNPLHIIRNNRSSSGYRFVIQSILANSAWWPMSQFTQIIWWKFIFASGGRQDVCRVTSFWIPILTRVIASTS